MKTKTPEKIAGSELVTAAEALIHKLDYMIAALQKSRGSTAAPSFFSIDSLLVIRSELMNAKETFVSHNKIWEMEFQKEISRETSELREIEEKYASGKSELEQSFLENITGAPKHEEHYRNEMEQKLANLSEEKKKLLHDVKTESDANKKVIETEIRILAGQLEKSYANAVRAYGELYRIMLDVLNADSGDDILYAHPDDLGSSGGAKIVLKIQ